MARYNLFKGKSRGSIGDVTFTTQNGIQISRVRNRHPRNPRTNQQMLQRAVWATIVRAYSAGKSFYSTAFESATTPRQNMTAFMSVNMDYLRQLIIDEIDNKTPVSKQRGRVVHPQSYTPVPLDGLTISQGTLTDTIFTVTPATVDTPLTVSMPAPASDTETVADYTQRIGLTSDTIYTIVANIVDTQISILYPQPLATPYAINYQSYFGTAQLTLKTTLPSMPITSATMADIFDIQYTGNVFPYSFAAIAFGTGTWTASILLRKSNQIGTLGITAYQSSTQQTTTSTMHWLSTYNAYGIITEYLFKIWGKGEVNIENIIIPEEPKPYDYEIEYLEVNNETGLAYIETDFYFTPQKYDIILTFMPLSISSGFNNIYITSTQDELGNIFEILTSNYNERALAIKYFSTNINVLNNSVNNDSLNILELNAINGRIFLNNNNQGFPNVNNIPNYQRLILFSNILTRQKKWRFYNITIKNGTNLLCDFIPVVKDNLGCIYDKVSNKLYEAQGGGKFTTGPKI